MQGARWARWVPSASCLFTFYSTASSLQTLREGRLPCSKGAAVGAGQPGSTLIACLPPARLQAQPEPSAGLAVDAVGAISLVDEAQAPAEAARVVTTYENADGRRLNDGRYDAFAAELSGGWAAVHGAVVGLASCRGAAHWATLCGGGLETQARSP